jgi:Histidine kinase-, DNA gyrase B-, and HSP90-like ATPase
MEKIKKPEALPDCKIINELIVKSNSKTDYEFDYLSQLEGIRKIISIEVSRINLLFPEYTPHDELYHLKRLFYVADQLLGDEIIENMNATELFLLSVSLYGHDWGMAMSEEEKKLILSGCKGEVSNTVNLLDDEKNRIDEFCRINNIELENIELEDWQEYVRLTHAFRSGKRIRKHFEPISTGVADFASRICEGHWLDFDIIDDYTSYPTDAAIHREIVNVKALTIYVRLIDLLDLGEDRTPFVLWKFVAPRNEFSKLEWAKHRALQAVTFPKYQLARIIQIDGSTDDQNVYMSIMDLKRYVDEQFRQCSDILNRINHSYHKLNISHIDWRIAPRGFEPVAIQFEFDRNRMFDILGDEIYQSNPYVFIRELLQNAIDAIEMRTEILEKKELSFIPKIKLHVTEDDDYYIVKITDNGIGMDEYIIRNYLTIAGKSYYRSTDFQKEGLKMDPISRFGIGILSCFMTSDYIEIETFKDPNTTKNQNHLKITIPNKVNYFKIKKNTETLNIGSTIKVFVIKNKLPNNKKTGNRIDFNITEYLKRTAGFVKYPITVFEKEIESLITNPNSNETTSSSEFKIDYKFPVEKAILPQNKEVVKEYFVEKRFHLKSDLNMTNFDGCITYLLPKSENIDIVNDGLSWPAKEASLINYKKEIKKKIKVKWKDEWISFNRHSNRTDRTDKTIIPERSYSVFMDGILVQEITPPEIELKKEEESDFSNYYSMTDSFLNPQFIVNIPKCVGMKIDLARTNVETIEKWDNPIWIAFFDHLKNNLVKDILLKEPDERLLSLAKLITFYKLTYNIIIEYLITNEKYPLPFISNSGVLVFQEFDSSKHDVIRIGPSEFSDEFYELLEANYISYKNYKGILNLWRGSGALVNADHGRFEKSPASISNMHGLIKSFVNHIYYIESIKFVTSPLGKRFPLVEKIMKIKPKNALVELEYSDIQKIKLDAIDNYNLTLLNTFLYKTFYSFPILIKFPKPYASKMFYGFKYLNLNNKVIKSFVNICISVFKAKEDKLCSEEIIGNLFDMINEVPFIEIYYSDNYEIKISEFNSQMNGILDEALKNRIIENDSYIKSEIGIDDFIENSITVDKKTKSFVPKFKFEKYLNGKVEWGKNIS